MGKWNYNKVQFCTTQHVFHWNCISDARVQLIWIKTFCYSPQCHYPWELLATFPTLKYIWNMFIFICFLLTFVLSSCNCLENQLLYFDFSFWVSSENTNSDHWKNCLNCLISPSRSLIFPFIQSFIQRSLMNSATERQHSELWGCDFYSQTVCFFLALWPWTVHLPLCASISQLLKGSDNNCFENCRIIVRIKWVNIYDRLST